MSIKKFFRFNRKILIYAFLLFLILVPSINYAKYNPDIRCITTPCPPYEPATGTILTYLLYSYEFMILDFNILVAILGIAICYIISCYLARFK